VVRRNGFFVARGGLLDAGWRRAGLDGGG
jgi:hypothetical protein